MAKENLFPENGFDVQIAGGSGSELSAKLTAAGEADFGLMGPDALLGVVQEGGKLISLGIVYDKTPVVIYSLKRENITSLQDLNGKRLGVIFGSNTYVQYKSLLGRGEMKGIEPKEVPVDGRSGPGLLDAGKIDALTYYGHYVDAFEAQSDKKYNQIHLSEFFPNLYGMVLATSQHILNRLGRENVWKFAELVKTAIQRANANPMEAIMALERADIGKIDMRSERGKLESVLRMACRQDQAACSEALEQSAEGWKDNAQTVKSLGIIRDADLWRSVILEYNRRQAVLP